MKGSGLKGKLIAVVALLVVAGVVVVVARASLSQDKAASKKTVALQTKFTKYPCKPADPNSVACLRQHYQTATRQKGATAAFDELKAAYNTNPAVKSDCHQITHVIGRTQAELSKSVSEAFSKGDNFCWAGFYHGAMEMFTSILGTDNLVSKLNTVCADIKKQQPYSFYHYNCVHGLGHGLFSMEENDLFKSLGYCDAAGDQWEQESCQGGVYMQNVMAAEDPDDHTDFLKPDQPMYPCTAVGDKYKQQCYLMQTSYALRMASYSFQTVFAECAATPGTYKDVCYQGLGRDASGNSVSDVKRTTETCALGGDYEARSNCLVGAVKDFVSYFHSDQQATALCQAQPVELVKVCEDTKVSYYKTF